MSESTDVDAVLKDSAIDVSVSSQEETQDAMPSITLHRTLSTQSNLDDDDESNNAEVRALAAKLAPDLEKADALFHVPAEFYSHQPMSTDNVTADGDYDDDLSEEEQALKQSEQLLRAEMELASDFSKLFASPRYSFDAGEGSDDDDQSPFQSETPERTTSMEADVDDKEHEQVPEQDFQTADSLSTSTPMSKNGYLRPIPLSTTQSSLVASPALSTPGILLAMTTPLHGSNRHPSSRYYTNVDHLSTLAMDTQHKGWYSIDQTLLVTSSSSKSSNDLISSLPSAFSDENNENHKSQSAAIPITLKEYCLAIPESRFKHVFVGLPEISSTTGASALPVRTLTIRIRPDVLCGAIMDSVYHALEHMSATVHKRQGGHIRATVPSATYMPARVVRDEETASEDSDNTNNSKSLRVYPGFFVDLQLCTYKADDCARLLLIRIYHDTRPAPVESSLPSPPRQLNDATNDDQENNLDILLATNASQHGGGRDEERQSVLEHLVDETAAYRLREACALIQRIETPQKRPKRIDANPTSPSEMKQVVSDYLLTNYHACPSVKEGAVTMPGLNSNDWPVIVSSWRLIRSVWDELNDRELSYNQLCQNWFGAFPALPTLDVHYCSQIRRLSREGMIVELLKSASELEDFAREAEYACANMISMLQPTFDAYDMGAPSLPKALPLTSYPLEFTAPQQACPPWGQKVMSALNEIQSTSDEVNRNVDHLGESNHLDEDAIKKSLDMADHAVQSVLQAFQEQDDEEKNARLSRKNVQVMDRLAKMEDHQLASIRTLDQALMRSAKAKAAAEDFATKSGGFQEVPLIKWSVYVGSATGTCFVTARRILFVTQRIPVIGGSTISMWPLLDIEFSVKEGVPSLLNPMPTTVTLTKDGQEVYNFRASLGGGARLTSFLEIVKATASKLPAYTGEV
jgi:hypothetical protein